jgi:hypothetical protein
MTGTHPEERKPQTPNRINPIAIIAGALASLSAAVVASYFGVAGTLIGTAVVSVISSLGAAIYAGLLGRTRGLVQRTTLVLQSLPERTGSVQTQGPSEGQGEGRAPAEGPADRQAPADAVPADRGPSDGGPSDGGPSDGPAGAGTPAARASVGWPWRRSVVVVGVVALLIFGIAIGALTSIEAAIKEPIASALGVRDKGEARTSVGVAVDRAGGSDTTRRTSPSSSSTSPPSSSEPGQTPPTTEPGPSTTTGGTAPPTTTPPTTSPPPPTTTPPSSPSTSGTP